MTAEWWTVLFAGVTAVFTCHLPRKAAEKETERKTEPVVLARYPLFWRVLTGVSQPSTSW